MLFLWSSNLYHFNCLYYSTSGTVCHFNTRSLCILEVIFSNRGTSTWMLLAEPYSTVQRDSLKGRWVSHQNALSSLRKKDWFCKKGIKYISLPARLAEHLKSTVLEHCGGHSHYNLNILLKRRTLCGSCYTPETI